MISDNVFLLLIFMGLFVFDLSEQALISPNINIRFKKKEIRKIKKSKQTKIKIMIEVKTGIFYNSSLSYEEQSEEFKEYVMQLYEALEKLPYPAFDADGNVSYFAQDNFLKYEFKRIQVDAHSTMNRAIKELQIIVTLKNI